ncbi:MAG: SAM-dependent methyltransferase [Methanomicrobiales archaeon]|nr:SAM-dependent methyltransferase [Methanomicrobiales archaeon]
MMSGTPSLLWGEEMRVRRVPKDHLSTLCQSPWYNTRRHPYVEGNIAYVPVRDEYNAELELPERKPYHNRGYYQIGDLILFHGPRPSPEELEAVIFWTHPRGVLWVRCLSEVTRMPDCELLYGECGEVCHIENGYRYWLDPSRIMFAQGNREERARMGALVRLGERAGDLCAGIGYFTLPMARAGARVHAIELNPLAYQFLLRNAKENGVEDRVQAECGDCRTLLSGIYDRLVIGHFDMLPLLAGALRYVHEGSVLHLHTIDPCEAEIRSTVKGAGFSPTMAIHRVKKYAPGRWHVVWDVTL